MGILQLKEVQDRIGMDSNTLAQRAGLTPEYISAVRTGKKFPREETLMRIAYALGVNVGDLFVSTVPRTKDDILNEIERLAREAREMV